MPLAVDSYAAVRTLADDPGTLNLAWTLDERQCLAHDVDALVARELAAEVHDGLPSVNRYAVQDPYGERDFAPLVAQFFGLPEARRCVGCGAGVISLLHAFARLAANGSAHVAGDAYPDFPYWVEQAGGRCTSSPPDASAQEHVAALGAGVAAVFLERPSLRGDRFSELPEVAALCSGAASRGAVVVIDESNANYYPAAFSAVHLVDAVDNLVVIRGFSKGYGLGGLRLSYFVASNALRERVRSLVPPLLASSLSLRIGSALLAAGDIAAPLRERIRAGKDALARALAAAELSEVLPSSEHLPYLFVRNSAEYVRARLEGRGVLGKRHPFWSGAGGELRDLYRLSAPLSPARLELLRGRLANEAAAGPVADGVRPPR